MNCAQLLDVVRHAPMSGWACNADGEFLRLETPFRYPDGGAVELFVESRVGSFLVTDYGEAFRFLETSGLDPLRSPTRQRLIDIATKLANARIDEGAIEIEVRSAVDVFPALLRLGQVVSRVADLSLFAKGTFANTFSDSLEEYLRTSTRHVEIKRGAIIRGSATTHQIDILAKSAKGFTAIEGLSAVTATGANAQTAFTIQKFADIAAIGPGAPERFAVLDDSSEVWTEALRKQLARFADVLDWEQRDHLVGALS